MPVIRVMDKKMVEKARPALKTLSQDCGIHDSIDTMNPARSTYQAILITRPSWGARVAAMVGGGGGSTEAMGSSSSCSWRMPRTSNRAATSTMKGSEGRTAADQGLEAGR